MPAHRSLSWKSSQQRPCGSAQQPGKELFAGPSRSKSGPKQSSLSVSHTQPHAVSSSEADSGAFAVADSADDAATDGSDAADFLNGIERFTLHGKRVM